VRGAGFGSWFIPGPIASVDVRRPATATRLRYSCANGKGSELGSTNRGRARESLDFYPTEWLTRAIVPALGQPRRILEPASGDGVIVHVLREALPSATIAATPVV
jgi:hypothetical protein